MSAVFELIESFRNVLALIGLVAVVAFVGTLLMTRRSPRRSGRAGPPVRSRRPKRLLVLADLAQRLSTDSDHLRQFVPAYHHARIPKRNGSWRTLTVPDEPTKRMQRRILRRLLGRLSAHPAAMGFEKGKSIADHAAQHSGRAIIVKCDLIDFFPSTTGRRVNDFFKRIGWDEQCAAILTRLCCHEGGLPQGAPTSPRLSNLVNRGFDDLLDSLATRRGMRYSRYADDLCFSYANERKASARRVRGLLQEVRAIARVYGYRLHGRDKTRIARRHQRQVVCGLIVNDRPNLPRALRRRLRAARHHHATGRAATLSLEQLAGWAAYEQMVHAAGPTRHETRH